MSLHNWLINFDYREQEKAMKEAANKAKAKGPMGGSGIKKSGKKWKWTN